MPEVMLMSDKLASSRTGDKKPRREEKPIPKVYPVIDTDLARDNVENGLTAADREDL